MKRIALSLLTLISVGLFAFACNERREIALQDVYGATRDGKVDASASPGDARSDTGEGHPETCVYIAEHVCWRCGDPIKSAERAHVGCRAPKDCRIYCNDNIPMPFVFCNYCGGAEESIGDCRGWVAPKAPLSSCVYLPGQSIYGQDLYACTDCAQCIPQAPTTAYGPGGVCHVFADFCLPEGYTLGDMGGRCP